MSSLLGFMIYQLCQLSGRDAPTALANYCSPLNTRLLHGTPCPTLCEWCVGSLTSHGYLRARVVRRDLRLIVLVREDLKVKPFVDVITKAAL